MKIKTLVAMLFLSAGATTVVAQDASNCNSNSSISHEAVRAGNFKDAYTPWKAVLENCPTLRFYTFTDGYKILKGLMAQIKDKNNPEYQKYFEKDKALERRFQIVMVDEPNELDAISILRGLKEKYENHHKVRIKDDAIIAAVELSSRYITDRFLPDKAIDLVDEACALIKTELDSMPTELDEQRRKIMQLEICLLYTSPSPRD